MLVEGLWETWAEDTDIDTLDEILTDADDENENENEPEEEEFIFVTVDGFAVTVDTDVTVDGARVTVETIVEVEVTVVGDRVIRDAVVTVSAEACTVTEEVCVVDWVIVEGSLVTVLV